jgi:3-hydroxyisobutyrate dehydrogenase-like beta-hydroxyacid dehydrogenase
MLADEKALRAVYEGADGLLAGWEPGKVALDMGTTGPVGTQWLAESVGAAEGTAVDSPVSGAVAAVEGRCTDPDGRWAG